MAYYGAAAGGSASRSTSTQRGGATRTSPTLTSPALLAEANAHVARSLVKLAKAKTAAKTAVKCEKWNKSKKDKTARQLGALKFLSPTSLVYKSLASKGHGAACVALADKSLDHLSQAKAQLQLAKSKGLQGRVVQNLERKVLTAEDTVHSTLSLGRAARQEASRKAEEKAASRAAVEQSVAQTGRFGDSRIRQQLIATIEHTAAQTGQAVEGLAEASDADLLAIEESLSDHAEYQATGFDPVGFVQENPIPVAVGVVGIGLLILAMRRR